MATVKVYNMAGKVVGDQTLEPKLFDVKPKAEVVYQVVVAQGANSRTVLAHTKTKAEVRGGGRKPFKQKHTGRARAGSIRSPLWRGGGVVFGPRKNRNFEQKVNKKMKNVALAMVLSDKVANDHLVVIDKITLYDMKTKTLIKSLQLLPCADKKTLMAFAVKDANTLKAAANVKNLVTIAADSINLVDVMKYDYLVIDQAGLTTLSKVFAK